MASTVYTARLQRDLRDLQREPLENIFAAPLEDNLKEWHVNMVPSSGPYTGLLTHLVLYFPDNYPHDPPWLKLCTRIIHPNVFDEYVCLDMLHHSNQRGQGWSPAYSVRSILMQIYGFLLLDDNIDQETGGSWSQLAQYGGDSYEHELSDLVNTCFSSAHDFRCEGCSHCWAQPWPEVSIPICTSALRTSDEVTAAQTLAAAPTQQPPITTRALPVTSRSFAAVVSSGSDAAHRLEVAAGDDTRGDRRPNGGMQPGTQQQRHAQPADVQAESSSTPPASTMMMEVAATTSTCETPTAAGPSLFDLLDDSLLERILSRLLPEDLHRCLRVDTRTMHAAKMVIRQSELVCYFSKLDFKQTTLGYGVQRDWYGSLGSKLRGLSSPMELLSWEAYQDGVRRSVWNEGFEQFLPLYINPVHGQRALQLLPGCITSILTRWDNERKADVAAADGQGGCSCPLCQPRERKMIPRPAAVITRAVAVPPQQAAREMLLVVGHLINCLVVDMVSVGGGDGPTSAITRGMCDASLSAFCHLHHLLVATALQPGSDILAQAQSDVIRFLRSRDTQHKRQCPDLGLLLVKYLITPRSAVSWQQFGPALVREALARQVYWARKRYRHFCSPQRDDFGTKGTVNAAQRLAQHFIAAKVSLRLLMLQAWFANAVARPSTQADLARIKSEYDARLGMAPRSKFAAFSAHARQVLTCPNWVNFLYHMGLGINKALEPRQAMVAMLRQAVVDSAVAGYHTGYDAADLKSAVYMDWKSTKPLGTFTDAWN